MWKFIRYPSIQASIASFSAIYTYYHLNNHSVFQTQGILPFQPTSTPLPSRSDILQLLKGKDKDGKDVENPEFVWIHF